MKKGILIVIAIVIVAVVTCAIIIIVKHNSNDNGIQEETNYKVNGVEMRCEGRHVRFEKNSLNYLFFMGIVDDNFKDKHISEKALKVLREFKKIELENYDNKDIKIVAVDVTTKEPDAWVPSDYFKNDFKRVEVTIISDKGDDDEYTPFLCEYTEGSNDYYIKTIEYELNGGEY